MRMVLLALPLLLTACGVDYGTPECIDAQGTNIRASQGVHPVGPQGGRPTQGLRFIEAPNSVMSRVTPVFWVRDLWTNRTATGNVRVSARLQSCVATQMPWPIEARALFVDQNGRQVEPPAAWKRVLLPSLGEVQYEEVSTTPRAAGVVIEFQSGYGNWMPERHQVIIPR